DVGVAMGARGSSAASESADVVITVDDLSRSVRAVQIGRRTMRVAWQAIGIGVAMSVGLMLVATTGALPAIVGAWLQEVVDLACILWALLAVRPSRAERAELARVAADLAAAGDGRARQPVLTSDRRPAGGERSGRGRGRPSAPPARGVLQRRPGGEPGGAGEQGDRTGDREGHAVAERVSERPGEHRPEDRAGVLRHLEPGEHLAAAALLADD